MNSNGKQFGDMALQHAIDEGRSRPLKESVATILASIESWQGIARSQDDISLLAMESSRIA
jgi:serine phosphatase RsbU (regulator of sigma subunit)